MLLCANSPNRRDVWQSRHLLPNLRLSMIVHLVHHHLDPPFDASRSHSQPCSEQRHYGPTMKTDQCAILRYPHQLSADVRLPKEPNDLSFQAGDIIEIVAETNADWWTGKVNGKQGLFPSNYVEKMSPSISPPSYPPPSDSRRQTPAPSPVPYNSGPPVPYQPAYNGPPQGYQSPPPQPYTPYMGPPSQAPPPQQVVVQQAPPAKPNRFGGLGQVVRV